MADGGGVASEEKDMISPSDLATTIQRPFIEVSKAMELFKLFEIAELIDENEMLYQWLDTERLENMLKRIYHDTHDVGASDLWNIVKGVVKLLLTERRVSRMSATLILTCAQTNNARTLVILSIMRFISLL